MFFSKAKCCDKSKFLMALSEEEWEMYMRVQVRRLLKSDGIYLSNSGNRQVCNLGFVVDQEVMN